MRSTCWMRLLHPMMPFLTEEVWQLLGQVTPNRGLPTAAKAAESVCVSEWPKADAGRQDAAIEVQLADWRRCGRGARGEAAAELVQGRLEFAVRCDATTAKLLEPMQPYFKQMANASATQIGRSAEPGGLSISFPLAGRQGPIEVHVDVSRLIDKGAERNGSTRNGRISRNKSYRSKASSTTMALSIKRRLRSCSNSVTSW